MYNGYGDSAAAGTSTSTDPRTLNHVEESGVADPLTIYPPRESTQPTSAAGQLSGVYSPEMPWYPNLDLSFAATPAPPQSSINPVSFYRALPRPNVEFPEPSHHTLLEFPPQYSGGSQMNRDFLYAQSMSGPLGTGHAAPA